MNNKFIEFAIKYQDFYNKLSCDYKQNISNLEEYGNLEIIEISKSASSNKNIVYLYIGKTDEKYCLMRCEVNYNVFDISAGKMIFLDKHLIKTKRIYK